MRNATGFVGLEYVLGEVKHFRNETSKERNGNHNSLPTHPSKKGSNWGSLEGLHPADPANPFKVGSGMSSPVVE